MNRSIGFTLIELVVTLAVAAIVITAAAPGFRALLQNNRAATQANELVSAFTLARSEAVKRAGRVSVCATADGANCSNSDDWSTGWMVFTDTSGTVGDKDGSDEILRVWAAPGGSPSITAANSADDVRFDGMGSGDAAVPGSVFSIDIELDGCIGDNGRTVNVNLPTGRVNVDTTSC